MSVRIVIHLGVLEELLVSKIRIMMRVFHRMMKRVNDWGRLVRLDVGFFGGSCDVVVGEDYLFRC